MKQIEVIMSRLLKPFAELPLKLLAFDTIAERRFAANCWPRSCTGYPPARRLLWSSPCNVPALLLRKLRAGTMEA